MYGIILWHNLDLFKLRPAVKTDRNQEWWWQQLAAFTAKYLKDCKFEGLLSLWIDGANQSGGRHFSLAVRSLGTHDLICTTSRIDRNSNLPLGNRGIFSHSVLKYLSDFDCSAGALLSETEDMHYSEWNGLTFCEMCIHSSFLPFFLSLFFPEKINICQVAIKVDHRNG